MPQRRLATGQEGGSGGGATTGCLGWRALEHPGKTDANCAKNLPPPRPVAFQPAIEPHGGPFHFPTCAAPAHSAGNWPAICVLLQRPAETRP